MISLFSSKRKDKTSSYFQKYCLSLLQQIIAQNPGTFMRAGAKIQNRLEKSANNSKENGQKAATNACVLLFHGHINSSGQVVVYGNCRKKNQ